MTLNTPASTHPVISRVVLVEVVSAASQLSASRAVLASFAPRVNLEYAEAELAT